MRSIANPTLPALRFDHVADQAGADGEVFLQSGGFFAADATLGCDVGYEPGHHRVIVEFSQGKGMGLNKFPEATEEMAVTVVHFVRWGMLSSGFKCQIN